MRFRLGICLAAGISLSASNASAGIYTDDLTKCLIAKANSDDQTSLVQWFFAAMSSSPSVKGMTTITPAQVDTQNQKIATLFERLIYSDCRKETVGAIKYEGPGAIASGFQVLGQVAARNLMTDPNVAEAMSNLDANFDRSKMLALAKEAGLPIPKDAETAPKK